MIKSVENKNIEDFKIKELSDLMGESSTLLPKIKEEMKEFENKEELKKHLSEQAENLAKNAVKFYQLINSIEEGSISHTEPKERNFNFDRAKEFSLHAQTNCIIFNKTNKPIQYPWILKAILEQAKDCLAYLKPKPITV